jgi:3-methyladenine DNA glycosylase Mpg
MKLDSSFYRREDVVQLSRELLGKVLCTDLPGGFPNKLPEIDRIGE